MPKPSGPLARYIADDKDFRGIGVALATRLSDRFGVHLRRALKDRDDGVIEILGYDIAENTFATFEFKSHEMDLIDWFVRKGIIECIGTRTAIRVARCWGGNGVEVIMDNPYLLTAFLPWSTVDKIGFALGIPPKDARRASAAVEAVLYARLDQNHTCTDENDVRTGVTKLLTGGLIYPEEGSFNPIDHALKNGGACRLGNSVQPFGAAVMEETIARTVAAAVNEAPYQDLIVKMPAAIDLDKMIENFSSCQPYELTGMQKKAIRLALTHRAAVLAGYAGSGKTTTLRGICDIADDMGRKLHLMALSGRAAQRISVSTGRPARTIAGFLQNVSGANAEAVTPGAMIIVDEASMLDLPTLWRIIKVMGDANLLLVGDPAQLPPIGFGLTFHVLCEAEHIPTSYCRVWCLRLVGHAAIWLGLVVSIPSLNVTPVMTLAR